MHVSCRQEEGQDDGFLLGISPKSPGNGKSEHNVEHPGGIAVDAVGILGGLPEGAAHVVQQSNQSEGEGRPVHGYPDVRIQFAQKKVAVTQEMDGGG